MALHEIKLAAQESNWRLFMVRKADPAFLSFEQKVFQRDRYTCQFCGFQAQQFIDVVNLDGNFRNNRLSNLVTSCPFCSQCLFLEAIGKSDFGGGTLVYLPEMSQGELNALCHVLFNAIVTNGATAAEAKNVYRSLRLRSQIVEQKLGEGMANPALYGQLLIESDNDSKHALHSDIGEKLRVLPTLSRFAKQVSIWAESSLRALSF